MLQAFNSACAKNPQANSFFLSQQVLSFNSCLSSPINMKIHFVPSSVYPWQPDAPHLDIPKGVCVNLRRHCKSLRCCQKLELYSEVRKFCKEFRCHDNKAPLLSHHEAYGTLVRLSCIFLRCGNYRFIPASHHSSPLLIMIILFPKWFIRLPDP